MLPSAVGPHDLLGKKACLLHAGLQHLWRRAQGSPLRRRIDSDLWQLQASTDKKFYPDRFSTSEGT